MGYKYTEHRVTDEDRREFLKALGIGGAVAAGGVTLDEARNAMTAAEPAEELAPVGQSIKSDLTGALDASLIAEQQTALATAASEIPVTLERGVPTAAEGARNEFGAVAEQGRPIYDHLVEAGFFESTTEHLPTFDLEVLSSSLQTFVASDELVAILEETGFGEEQGVDLLATVISNAEELENYHWVATEELPGEALSPGDAFPTATQAAAGGVLLWLEDLDLHLWQKGVLVTDEIHADAAWHGESMAAGFYLMSEAAKHIGAESGALSESELGALLTTSFAVQAISQGRLPQNVYWITEQMRKPRA